MTPRNSSDPGRRDNGLFVLHGSTLGNHEDTIRRAIDALPYPEAEALWLVDACGCTYAEAATTTHVAVSTFVRRLHGARLRIRSALPRH